VTGAHLHIQVCRSSAFPADISMSADPLSFVAAAPGPAGDGLADVLRRLAALEARDVELNRALVAERFELGRLALHADITLVQRAVSVLRTAGVIGGSP
jgi:hypothetical protein